MDYQCIESSIDNKKVINKYIYYMFTSVIKRSISNRVGTMEEAVLGPTMGVSGTSLFSNLSATHFILFFWQSVNSNIQSLLT